jgi:hypothetical protein
MNTRTIGLALFLALFCQTSLANVAADSLTPVVQLYRDYAWEIVITKPATTATFLTQPDAVWRRYLSPRLIKLLRRDRDCVRRTKEICKLDFDPIWGSQDPTLAALAITADAKPQQALVTFTFPETGTRTILKFKLVNIDSAWRIDDIVYADGAMLSGVLK